MASERIRPRAHKIGTIRARQLNLPVADDMEGRVLLEAIKPAVRKATPVQMIATYETGTRRAGRSAQPSVVDEEYLEQLRSLGYIH